MLDALADNPFISAKGASERLKLAFTTAQRAIAVLERTSIIEQVAGQRRGRVYCARALLKVLEEPWREVLPAVIEHADSLHKSLGLIIFLSVRR